MQKIDVETKGLLEKLKDFKVITDSQKRLLQVDLVAVISVR